MGSVINYIECSRCKQENCMEDYYYKTGEVYIHCPDCGYHRAFFYKRDANGNLLRKDETKGFEYENLIPEEIHFENPYGAFRVVTDFGNATCGTLNTDENYQEFVSEIVSVTNKENDIKKVVVSKLVGDKIEVEILYEN